MILTDLSNIFLVNTNNAYDIFFKYKILYSGSEFLLLFIFKYHYSVCGILNINSLYTQCRRFTEYHLHSAKLKLICIRIFIQQLVSCIPVADFISMLLLLWGCLTTMCHKQTIKDTVNAESVLMRIAICVLDWNNILQ